MIALLGMFCLLAVDPQADADALFSQGRYPQAAAIYSSLLKASPSDPRLLLALGQTLRAMQQPRQAIPYLLRETQSAPNDHVGARALAAAMQEANEFSEGSTRFLTTLAQSDSGSGEIWYRLGLLFYQNGYYGPALENLDRSLASMTVSDRNSAETVRAICLMQTGRPQDAAKAIAPLLARPANVKNLDLLLASARLHYEAGEYEDAIQLTNRAIAADNRNASAHFWRARILQQEAKHPDELKEAAAEAERARDLSPASPAPRNLLVRIYQKLDRPEDAAREADWIRQHQTPSSTPPGGPQ
jgi:tetratricopeptide (TPR) repeat protein